MKTVQTNTFRPRHVAFGALAAIACAGLAGCIPPSPEPSPPAVPTPTPAPAAAPTPPPSITLPPPANWMDAPRTPGDWTYRETRNGTAALYGPPNSEAIFAMRCNADRTITLSRTGEANGAVPMRILTETATRTLNAQAVAGELPRVEVSLNANDPLLDAMAFSKGRFAVETSGMPTLYIPSWPEVTRVIEDCR